MGSILFPAIPSIGSVDGRLDIRVDKYLTLDELLTHLPAAKSFLKELSGKGWRYYFIEGYGIVVMQLEMASSPYAAQVKEHPRGGLNFSLSLDFGRSVPQLKLGRIIDLHRFIVNICSKHYPRAITVDLSKSDIIYVHESLQGTKKEEVKEEVRDIMEILQWLIGVKKFKLGISDRKRYKELMTLLGE